MILIKDDDHIELGFFIGLPEELTAKLKLFKTEIKESDNSPENIKNIFHISLGQGRFKKRDEILLYSELSNLAKCFSPIFYKFKC